ncbi:MAG: 2-succinyl-6-hydroxy-2,4-cyclohexadiene-1-carboxylate synthase [Epsilonproteobacteria bacterium]|nr:MAG: 2-succinyl-6-hydroxy-2,4-cyclohexadiene-1-carboxylate synthase [Campylobacterota bacterium]RLA65760.1 MAG: 2-succinyl-6-hydroxy-2,4-cyclohexadiene-1-carboxylate synthase [Campylobacterota bacterium]
MKLDIKNIGNPKNPPILFLHGFMGKGSDWSKLATELSQNYYCHLIDLPGHGKSTAEVENLKDLTRLILDSLSPKKKLTIIGYSMGGRIALYMILTFPELFNKAIIESASPGIKNIKERETRYQSDLNLLSDIKSFRSFLNSWYENPLFGDLTGLKETLIEEKLENDPEKLKSALKFLSVGNQPNLWEMIKKLSVPTLYISGDRDKKYSQIGEELTELSPMITKKVIKNAAHITHLQNPKEFNTQVALFLSK